MLPKQKSLILDGNMRWIYISPHFDDAVLSCGGLIWEQTRSGLPVEIWTINAGMPPAGPVSDLITRIHTVWKTGTPPETVALRRIEDQNAARRVGAVTRHLDGVDAIYRRSPEGELLYTQDVFDPIHPAESGIVAGVARMLAGNLTQYDTLICPLALGGHVDHVITRQATESLNRPLWYYADIPYLFHHEETLAPAVQEMNSMTFPISAEGLAAWQDSIAAHASQLTSLFVDVQDMQAQIKNYRHSRNGLSLWERA